MKSLSKVIKSHETILINPVCIDRVFTEAETKDNGSRITSEDRLREEADKIMRETEEMIVELLNKARLEAQHIIAEAQEEALDLRLKAEKEAQVLRQQAVNEGYEAGWKKALDDTREQIDQARSHSQELLDQARKERLAILGSCEGILVRLALDIAQKIVEKELTINPDITVNLVKKIMEFMHSADAFKVLVSPEDFAGLVDEFADLSQSTSSGKLQIAVEKGIKPGGCVVETDLGVIDARLETRISSLENALMEVVGGN